jgi:hypothetical protein
LPNSFSLAVFVFPLVERVTNLPASSAAEVPVQLAVAMNINGSIQKREKGCL